MSRSKAAAVLAVLAGLLGGALSGCASSPPISVTPGVDTSIDTPLSITVGGLRPGSLLRVSAQTQLFGQSWSSAAAFEADSSGSVDLTKQAPVSGSYSGVHPMGLLWSLRSGGPPGSASVADVTAPERLQLELSGAKSGHIDLTRRIGGASVADRAIRPGLDNGGLYADFVYPAAARQRSPAVVLIGGAEGGLDTGLPVAEVLAARGVAVLDVAYFGAPGLPVQLSQIPLEYFANALLWLGRQPQVDAHRLYLYGVSRGTEAALLTAAHFPSLVRGVIALMPAGVAFCGEPDCRHSAWTYRGADIPFTDQVSTWPPTDNPRAAIPIGNFSGRLLLVCAGRDQRWDSCIYTRGLAAAATAAGHPAPLVLDFPDAGHGAGFAVPYLPDIDTPTLAGASPAANPEARAEEWPKIVAFLTRSG